ncbi:fumarylacetoacetate hydrolase family protein [Microbacterium sp.]|uniref:fumarylacetoacetate hydrolase family protein n=1 Tax=Microbacterium sp. TaxID=51671 RepID=UPI003F6FFF27
MRLARWGEEGREIPVVIRPDGHVVDVSHVIGADSRGLYEEGALLCLAEAASTVQATVPKTARRGSPVPTPGKIVCVGLNYRAHAHEAGMAIPDEPILFMKAPDTVVGADDALMIPPGSLKTDYEVELGVVIGRTARRLPDDADPLDHVLGYLVLNDVSEREYQLERGGSWDKGKNFETFCPLGPELVTADEVPDPQALRLTSRVNGEVRQDSSTADMIFPVAELVRYISQVMTLYPGDVIATGTPQGVGSGYTPPRFLQAGDVVEIEIETLGLQRQTCEPS